jgi:hypothetical protein
VLRLYNEYERFKLVLSYEVVASQQRHKHESRRISVVGNCNQAMASEDCNRLRQHVL